MKVKLVTIDGCERFMEIENPVRVIEVPILLGTHRTFGGVLDIDGPTAIIRRYEYHHTEHRDITLLANILVQPAEGLPVYIESYPYLEVRREAPIQSEPTITNKRQLREGD